MKRLWDFRNVRTGEVVVDAVMCENEDRPQEINPDNYESLQHMILGDIDPDETYVFKFTATRSEPQFRGTDWSPKGDALYATAAQKKRLQDISDEKKRMQDKGILAED